MNRLEANILHHAKKQREQRKYFINDVIKAGYNIEPLTCLNCNSQEVTFNQHLNDAYCSECGTWQDE